MTAALATLRQFGPHRPGSAARWAERALAAGAQLGWAGTGCCLTFHRAVSAASWPLQANPGFHVDIAFLERLLRHVQRTGWDIVSLDEALRRTAARDRRRFINVSVDDCYRDTAELVVPLFRKLRAPVTLFVTTGIPDGTLALRDAGLETILLREDCVVDGERRFPLRTAAERRLAYAAISRRWDESGDGTAAYHAFCREHGYEPEVLDAAHRITWDTLRSLSGEPLVEIGGHTINHPRVSSLSAEAAAAEIGGCRERLEQQLGRAVRHFAFPYGRRLDCGQRDGELARAAGFASAATTRKGLIGPATDPFALPRNTINGTHRQIAAAYAHLSGLSGLAAGALGRD